MAKKSTTTRHTTAARRPQTSGKTSAVKLVRPEGATVGVSAGTPVIERPTQSAPARPAPAAKSTSTAKATSKPAPKTSAPSPLPSASRPASPAPTAAAPNPAMRAQLQRAEAAKLARAREMQRARAANLITPEHYGYVKNDLRLIGILAAFMFAIIIVLHFVLG